MSAQDGGPAFPQDVVNGHTLDSMGMTLRDYFAAKAMHAILSDPNWIGAHDEAAAYAYKAAAAMLKERVW